MTKQHVIAYYLDGHVQVAYCEKCSAEGQKLLEDCPQKVLLPNDKINEDFFDLLLDEKKQKS